MSSMWNSISSGTTPGVKRIEAAYSRAGATSHHTPGSASKLGSQDQMPAHGAHQGVGSAQFADGIADQRTQVNIILPFQLVSFFVFVFSPLLTDVVQPSMVGKVFDNLLNGTDHTGGKK